MNELNPFIDKSAPIADALEIEPMLKWLTDRGSVVQFQSFAVCGDAFQKIVCNIETKHTKLRIAVQRQFFKLILVRHFK